MAGKIKAGPYLRDAGAAFFIKDAAFVVHHCLAFSSGIAFATINLLNS